MIDRYTLPRMREIWELEGKFQKWLQIELLACEAWSELGQIPREAVERIRARAGFTVDRVLAIEQLTRHDVIAFTTAVGERLGEDSRYFHYGLTSSDVVDTALSWQMREAADIILEDLERLAAVIAGQARRYKDTVTIGRTHGVHAEPTTFGLKLANWYTEISRDKERMEHARANISYGKLSGAVGNFA
ncbi:MAG: lyase family protein, partial [Firmicutes bacterium]|nr:lyase family protein [Bacillota bacterium]